MTVAGLDWEAVEDEIAEQFQPRFDALEDEFRDAKAQAERSGAWPQGALVGFVTRLEALHRERVEVLVGRLADALQPLTKNRLGRRVAAKKLKRVRAELERRLTDALGGWNSTKVAAAVARGTRDQTEIDTAFGDLIADALLEV